MKKIVSNILVVSSQLLVGGLFLIMIFSDKTEDNKVVVVRNNNLTKMADVVSSLYVEDEVSTVFDVDFREVLLSASDDVETDTLEDNSIVETEEVSEEVSQEVQAEPQKLISIDADGYISNSEKGFNVTTEKV